MPDQVPMVSQGVGWLLDAAQKSLVSAGMIGKPLLRLSSRRHAVFVGDTEGKIGLTKEVFRRYLSDEDTTMVFLGDYIDRGPYQIENVCELLMGAMKAPGRVVLIRGNHETEDVSPHDFPKQVRRIYGTEEGDAIYRRTMQFFAQLPLAAVVDGYFCVHGGIPDPVPSLAELETLRIGVVSMVRELPDETRPEIQLVWNDPAPPKVERHLNKRGFLPNDPRGIGMYYGPQAVEAFLSRNDLKGIIRGHGGAETAIRTNFNGRVVTIDETGPSSHLTPWVQGLLHLEDAKLHAEIFPNMEELHPDPEASNFAVAAEKSVNQELTRSA